MKKRFLALLMVTALAVAGIAGCGGGNDDKSGEKKEEKSEEKTETIGSDAEDATELEMWVFVEQHKKFYEAMVDLWNEQNEDKQIKINANVMPYDDMHNKLQIALTAGGEGAPDMVDIELGKFSNFTQGTPELMDLTEAAAPYRDDIVESRLNLYSKDGALYGLPTHVGATVAFYNTELLEEADINYEEIVTWDDYKEAGKKYKEETGKSFGTADTYATWVLNAIMAQLGTDYVDADGNLQVDNDDIVKALEMLKDMQDAGAIDTVPGGQPDTEEAKGAFNSGEYAAQIMPLWQMSRFTEEMTDLEGKIAIAPIPTMDGAKALSVGGGGTGTAVVKSSENADLAAEFLAYAKLSEDANIQIWEVLGFDPCNMSIWEDEEITHNEDNKYIQYFVNNPFDVLNEIKSGIEGLDSMTSGKYPSINDYFVSTTLNEIFEDEVDPKEALEDTQDYLVSELE